MMSKTNDKTTGTGDNKYIPGKKDTSLLSLSRFSDLAEISRDTLVYYIKEGLITPAVIEKNGYQYFDPDQLRTMTFIKYMRRFGIHISEIKSMLSGMDTNGIYRILNSHSQEIDEKIRQIEQALLFLDKFQDLMDFIEKHPVDTPFLCNLKETDLYLTPVSISQSLNQMSNAAILSDFLDFDNKRLPEHLICCRIPENILLKDDFCTYMKENMKAGSGERIISKPAGTFACIIHQGGKHTIKATVKRLKDYLRQLDIAPAGDAYILNSAGYFNLTPSGKQKYLVEIPVKPVRL